MVQIWVLDTSMVVGEDGEREREREMMIACEVRGRKRRGREGGREGERLCSNDGRGDERKPRGVAGGRRRGVRNFTYK